MPTASIVIPSWNGLKFLKLSLPSLAKQTFKDSEIIVVDNGSDDGSGDYVRRHWPKVKLLEFKEALGFAGAINRGIEVAAGRYVVLLNNDLELDPAWLAEMVDAAKRHPKAGSIAGKMMEYDRRDHIDEVGNITSWYGVVLPRGRGERDTGQYDTEEPVFAACAGAALYRRQALEQVGLLDEDFFAYLEDTDWGFRAQLMGWECWYTPKAKLYHVIAGSNRRISGFFQYQSTRNANWFVIKNFPAAALFRHAPRLAFAQAKTLLGAIRGRWFGTYLRASGAALWKLPKMLVKRRRIQRQRKVSMAYLNTVITNRWTLPSKLLKRS